MAIPINKYVDLISGLAGRDAARRRDFMCLCLTASDAAKNYFVTRNMKGEDGNALIAEFADIDEVKEAFGNTTLSAEYRFAQKYFGFTSKSITRARLLKFAYWQKEFPTDNGYGYGSYAQRARNSAYSRSMFEAAGDTITFSLTLEGLEFRFDIDLTELTDEERGDATRFYARVIALVNDKIRFLRVDNYEILSVKDLNLDLSTQAGQSIAGLRAGQDFYHFEIRGAKYIDGPHKGEYILKNGSPVCELISNKVYPEVISGGETVQVARIATGGGSVTYTSQTLSSDTYFVNVRTEGNVRYCTPWSVYSTSSYLLGAEICEGDDVYFGDGFEYFGLGDNSTIDVFKSESPVDAISRIAAVDDNFGSFFFLDQLPAEQVVEVAAWNHNQNYKFLFSYSDTPDNLKQSGLALSLAGYDGTVLTSTPDDELVQTGDSFVSTEYDDDFIATHFIGGATEIQVNSHGEIDKTDDTELYSSYIRLRLLQNTDGTQYVEAQRFVYRKGFAYLTGYVPPVLFATTKYHLSNSTKTFMYQTFGTAAADADDSVWFVRDPATVKSRGVAAAFDKLNINYIGETQQAGKIIRFYQDGYNTNGLDTACYCNEVWFKDAIICEILNAFIANEKLDANNVGSSIVRMRVVNVCKEAIDNGTIIKNKELTTTQMEYIDRLTGVEGAWQSVRDDGYWLEISLSGRNTDKSTAYTASYRCIYSKGDAIRKVEGTNIML